MKGRLTVWRARWERSNRARSLRLLSFVVLMISLVIAIYLLISNWRLLSAYDWEVSWTPLLVALPLYPVAIGLVVRAWSLSLTALGARARFLPNLSAYFLANLARKLPTPLWFLGSRVVLSRQDGIPTAISSAALVVEQAMSLLAALVLSLLSGLAGGIAVATGVVQWALTLVALICAGLLFWQGGLLRLTNWILGFFGPNQHVVERLRLGDLMGLFGLHFGSWTVGGLIYCLVVSSLQPVALDLWPTLVSLSALGGAVSFLSLLLPAGLGLREAVTATMLAVVLPLPVALSAPILMRVWYLCNELFWAGLAALSRRGAALENVE